MSQDHTRLPPTRDEGQGRTSTSATPSHHGADLWPVFEFRPLDGALPRGADVYRYAEGLWLPDDGEYDLAFSARTTVLMFEPSYQRNILWAWLDGHWSANEPRHPRNNPWHYALREGATAWGGDWGRDEHPNARAGQSGMNWTCSKHQCASGRHVEFKPADRHILAGLVRDRATKEVVTVPENLTCMYCGSSPKAKVDHPPGGHSHEG